MGYMRDTERLGRALRRALLASPFIAGCTPTDNDAARKPQTKTAVEPEEAKPTPEPDEAEPTPEPDNVRAVSCDYGYWCAPADRAKLVASPEASVVETCVDEVILPEGTESLGGYISARGDVKAQRTTHEVVAQQTTEGPPAAGDCCYQWVHACKGGRPLLDQGLALTAPVAQGEGWAQTIDEITPPEDPHTRSQLQHAWLADALAEHASVAAFARATIELMAVGAPPALLAETQQAALDEIRHASVCFGLARAYGADAPAPGPLPVPQARPVTLISLACDTFGEGCVGETTAALVAHRAAEGCRDPGVRAALRAIADDEARHAALAWRIVAWALSQDPHGVGTALQRLWATLDHGPPARPSDAGHLPEHGRLGDVATQTAGLDARRQLIAPLLDELLNDRVVAG